MLVVTLGDPYSTTVELLGPFVREEPPGGQGLLIGSLAHWRDQEARLGRAALSVEPPSASGSWRGWRFLDIGGATAAGAERLSPRERGRIAVEALEALRERLSATGRLAVITAPIDKAACKEAGFRWPGHTEFFEELWGERAVMLLAGPRLKVGLVTNHLALKDVAASLSSELITRKILLLARTLREVYGIADPRIGVCALNPHAGDGGLFGSEDDAIVRPAILAAERQGVLANGPLPADTVFYFAANGRYDAVLAMYHDQGLGPLKTLHFDDAVNVSGGLPHLRVSPDHGPGQDLFLGGSASAASWKACFDVARRYLGGGER